ncbi:MAG: hypothetical protein ACPG1C_03445 [Alphaproteobacteria bacterium]
MSRWPNAPIHDTVIWTAKDGFSFDTDDATPAPDRNLIDFEKLVSAGREELEPQPEADVDMPFELVGSVKQSVAASGHHRTDFNIYAYLATPDGQIRRFDPEDGWGGDGVVLWPSGTLWYYDDIPPYDAETLQQFGD